MVVAVSLSGLALRMLKDGIDNRTRYFDWPMLR